MTRVACWRNDAFFDRFDLSVRQPVTNYESIDRYREANDARSAGWNNSYELSIERYLTIVA